MNITGSFEGISNGLTGSFSIKTSWHQLANAPGYATGAVLDFDASKAWTGELYIEILTKK